MPAEIMTSVTLIDDVLSHWCESLGTDGIAYRGHVYRVFNLCRGLAGGQGEFDEAIAVAAVFHDLAIWSDSTFDYIEPSVQRASDHLCGTELADCTDAIALMISEHHRLRRYRGAYEAAVEPFRRADLIDLSAGVIRFGVSSTFIRELRRAFPYRGFHTTILGIACRWAVHHPLDPLPMVKL